MRRLFLIEMLKKVDRRVVRNSPVLGRKTGGATNYDDQANQNLAKNLGGHLLLADGTVDDNVPPNNPLLMLLNHVSWLW